MSHAFFKVIAYFWVCYQACMLGTKCNCLLCTTKVYILKIYCYPIVWCYHFESSIWLQLNLTSSWKWRLMFHLHNYAFATESRGFFAYSAPSRATTREWLSILSKSSQSRRGNTKLIRCFWRFIERLTVLVAAFIPRASICILTSSWAATGASQKCRQVLTVNQLE